MLGLCGGAEASNDYLCLCTAFCRITISVVSVNDYLVSLLTPTTLINDYHLSERRLVAITV